MVVLIEGSHISPAWLISYFMSLITFTSVIYGTYADVFEGHIETVLAIFSFMVTLSLHVFVIIWPFITSDSIVRGNSVW